MNDNKLQFAIGNSKLALSIANFSLPAGWTCPFAKECLSKSNPLTGKIIDGEHCRFRCFAATNEARATTVRNARWRNFHILRDSRSVEKMGQVIQDSLPPNMDKIRTHVSGDFWSEKYFLAWVNVAMNNPMKTFYGYTKALPFIVKYKKYLPSNFRFVASKGGTHDHLIAKHHLVFAEVVLSFEEADEKGLEIDHDDSLAFSGKKSFALLIHATQPAGTPSAAAWSKLKRDGVGGYKKNKASRHIIVPKPIKLFIDIRNNEIVRPQLLVPKIKQYKFTPQSNIKAVKTK